MAAPGRIEVLEFVLINNYGSSAESRYEIYSSVETFSLYEHMFFEYMFGVAKIIDANELYNTLPITTNTYLYIKLKCPLTGRVVKSMFKIYKISDVKQESPKMQEYFIQFISVEMFNSMRSRISKVVNGDLTKEIEQLHKSYSNKPIEVDSEALRNKIIIPFMTPLNAIKLLVKNIKWKGIMPDYCYWENLYKFNCKSISSCGINGAVHDIMTTEVYHDDKYNSYSYADYSAISEIFQPQNFDSLQSLYNGYSGSTVFTYDPITATERYEPLGNEPFAKAYAFSDTSLDYISLSKRDQLLRSVSEKYFYVRVPGLLERTSGDIANLNIRMGNTLNIKNTENSGRKLICGITHQIQQSDYFQHLTLSNYQYA